MADDWCVTATASEARQGPDRPRGLSFASCQRSGVDREQGRTRFRKGRVGGATASDGNSHPPPASPGGPAGDVCVGTTGNVLGWGTSTSRELDGGGCALGTRAGSEICHRLEMTGSFHTEPRRKGRVDMFCLRRVTTHVSTQCRTYQHGLSRNVASLEGATCMAEQGWWRSHDWGTLVPRGTPSQDRVAWWRAGLPLPS